MEPLSSNGSSACVDSRIRVHPVSPLRGALAVHEHLGPAEPRGRRAYQLSGVLSDRSLCLHPAAYPPSVFFVDSILLLCTLGGLRLTRRIWRELGYFDQGRRVLVYGAGNAGESIVRDMHHNRPYAYQP